MTDAAWIASNAKHLGIQQVAIHDRMNEANVDQLPAEVAQLLVGTGSIEEAAWLIAKWIDYNAEAYSNPPQASPRRPRV